ncbi:hypothetical protein [Mongoliitalea daihaiensis]|uniref:hypothetical protein n=1 Tax=Mongoliitalea daihaiensis TaxID=2782006 RepID=UPI001F3C3A34|nr:hypothetical protein [Mongoliitalea daihaiensis]UJP64188.1 hypothetical protein IPZ59_15420 [Mongoliitalea daihaiensis]
MQSENVQNRLIFICTILYLIGYWFFTFDGITFSDDVVYMEFGRAFWAGETFPYKTHFADRWGAYIFSGFFTHFFDFNERTASFASLLSYLLSYSLLFSLLQSPKEKLIFSLLYLGQVYFLYFIHKVYPDSILLVFICLIVWSAIKRNEHPVFTGFCMSIAFLLGFITKETIVFLLPFPLILFGYDWKNRTSIKFYYAFFSASILLLISYFGYYQLNHGNWMYRFTAVNEGHYISDFTYHDKGWIAILKRLTYLPFQTFIERSYWPYIVTATVLIVNGNKSSKQTFKIIALTSFCLLLGFWFMSSTLEFYNPIYLNPRHLIILVPLLSWIIATSSDKLFQNKGINRLIAVSFLIAAMLSWNSFDLMVYYGALALLLIGVEYFSMAKWLFIPFILLPSVVSGHYHYQNKNYAHMKQTYQSFANSNHSNIKLANSFLVYSNSVLLAEADRNKVLFLGNWKESVSTTPPIIEVFIYKFYKHAYPLEQNDWDHLQEWLIKENYKANQVYDDQWIEIWRFENQVP